MSVVDDMASSTTSAVATSTTAASRKSTNISASAYAMGTTVESSAEFVLAVLSSNTVPSYSRSISQPCGNSNISSSSSSPKKQSPSQQQQQQQHQQQQNENESPTSHSPSASVMSSSPGSDSRKSYPGATVSESSGIYQDSRDHVTVEGGMGGLKKQNSQEDHSEEQQLENEEDSCCDDGQSISEDRSLTESIPDSFHTPSASIQNLSINVSNSSAKTSSTNNLRSSTKSTSSNTKSESDSGSISSGGSGSNNNNNNCNFNNNNNHHHHHLGSGGNVVEANNLSSSSNTSSRNDVSVAEKDKDKKQSPIQRNKEFIEPPIKGSPESQRQNFELSVSQVSNLSTSTELTTSVESNVSRESSGSSGKETVVVTPQYGPKNKKKMWYHVFYPSYKTRSGDFKKIFKELPLEERLIVDYSCALQKEILIQGRMYVSQNYISFYANIFGWETQTSIRLKDVTSITKEKTALVIPNAVQVSTETEKFFFTSFVTRDATYVMLFKLWQSSLLEDVSKTLPTKEIWKLVHSCYGEELGVASEEDAEDFLACTPGSLVNAPSVSTLMSGSDVDDGKSISEIDVQVCTSENGGDHLSLPLEDALVNESSDGLLNVSDNNAAGISRATTDLSDSSDSEVDVERAHGHHLLHVDDSTLVEIPLCPVPHQVGKEVVNSVIPTDVDSLFTMLFTSSKFFLDLHTARKTFDIVQSQWQESSDGSQKTRQVSFTVTLNHVMGPKHSQVTETQVMLPVSKPGRMYAIDVESVNAGIPYADSFYVTTHFCLSRLSPNETKLCIVNQIKYKKSVWKYTKGFIEKNTWAGLEEFYTYLERALKEECGKRNCGGQSQPVSPIACRPGRKRHTKGRAPDVPRDVHIPVGVLAISSTNKSLSIRNGSIPNSSMQIDNATVSSGSQTTTAEGSTVLKIILAVLACLLLLNAFLYVKLARFETASKSHLLFPSQPIAFPKTVPRNREEWQLLLQQQEDLHRLEMQKWHEILISALKILHQAEEDLESLKYHITSYNSEKFSASALKEAVEMLQAKSASAYNAKDSRVSHDKDEDRGEDLNDRQLHHSDEAEHLASTNNNNNNRASDAGLSHGDDDVERDGILSTTSTSHRYMNEL